MDIFISWSGDRSKRIAEALRDWFIKACAGSRPFVSEDIAKGDIWWNALQDALGRGGLAILVLTSESQHSTWVHFEAGSFFGKAGQNRVCPLLMDPAMTNLGGPLAKLQSTVWTQKDFSRLFDLVHEGCGGNIHARKDVYDKWWPEIAANVSAISTETESSFLEKFVTRSEASILNSKGPIHVSMDRAYRILLHMFNAEKFKEFRAFDLAFHRWHELLEPKDGQTLNVSARIFEAVESLMREGRCKRFRRILVAGKDELPSTWGREVLGHIKGREDALRADDIDVETKVLMRPESGVLLQQIQELGDVAVFESPTENLAIVEPELTGHEPDPSNLKCELVNTDEARLVLMKERFDRLWAASESIEQYLDNPRRVARKALESFAPRRKGPEGVAVLIEAAYVEYRDLHSVDRRQHTHDAQRLIEELVKKHPSLSGRIYLSCFVNDFEVAASVCEEYCAPLTLRAVSRKLVMNSKAIVARATEEIEGHVEPFFMKQTRSRVMDRIRKALKNEPGLIKDEGGTLFAETDEGPKQIGRYHDKNHMTVRCAALLGQHYADLLKYVRSKCPDLEELWIFDFSRFTERDQVRIGAGVAFSLFPALREIDVHVVNVIYLPDGRNTVQVSNG